MQHHVTFIGAATSWGAAYRGPELAPMALWMADLAGNTKRPHVTVDWHGILEPCDTAPEHDLKLYEAYDCVVRMSETLAREVAEIMAEQPLTMPVIIGGDHSVAFGTWSGVVTALEAFGKFGLLWIDAHMDAHTPVTCGQGKWGGHFHGMPLAHLLGHGDRALCAIGSYKTKLDPRHVALVGVRSYEPAEEELLRRLGVTFFTADDIRRDGLDHVMKQAIAIVSGAEKGWGLSWDVDVLDPQDVDAVGTPEPDGLRADDFLRCWSALKFPSPPKAVEIVEYIPAKDPEGKGKDVIEKFLWLLLKK